LHVTLARAQTMIYGGRSSKQLKKKNRKAGRLSIEWGNTRKNNPVAEDPDIVYTFTSS